MSRWKVLGVGLLVVALSVVGGALGVGLVQGRQAQEGMVEQMVGSGFMYQGSLSHEAGPVDGRCDFNFALYDAVTGGEQLGDVQSESGVTVEDGRFSVLLNGAGQFGPEAYDGEARWLEIAVRCDDEAGFANLGRQPLTATPYAHFSLAAATVPWSGVTGVPEGLDDGDDDTRYTAGDGLLLSGNQFSAAGASYANVVVVAKSGGDFTSVQAALDSISDAAEGNRYLVWIGPGVYEEQVTMKPYVDVAGAGQRLTIIRHGGLNDNPFSGSFATVQGADESELRFLTVESIAADPDYNTMALYGESLSHSFRLTDVTLVASGGYENYGALFDNSSPIVTDVRVMASGHWSAGFYNMDYTGPMDSSPAFNNVSVSATGDHLAYGISNDRNVIVIRDSQIYGTLYSLEAEDGTTRVASSELESPVAGEGFTCVHSYDAAFVELDGSCQ